MITRTVQSIGNGAHVYLPKEMVGHKVVITIAQKTTEEIKEEVLNILKPYLKNIVGVYLYGSYARAEQTPDSDIDILVLTDEKIKAQKRIGDYQLMVLTIDELEKTIKNNSTLILPILKEAKPIINAGALANYNKTPSKKSLKWYLDTTETSLALAKDWIEDKEMKSIPNIIYPLMMRLRGLHMIESLITNKPYSNMDVDRLLKGLPADQINAVYRQQRDDKPSSKNSLNYDDINQLYLIVKNKYNEVKKLWAKLS